MLAFLGFILAVITFPVSLVALLIQAIFHLPFWMAYWIVFIVAAIFETTTKRD